MQENLDQAKSSLAHRLSVDYYSFLAPTGYTQAAVDNIKSMESCGISVALRCMHGKMVGTGFSSQERDWINILLNKKSIPNAMQLVHSIPPRWSVVPKNKKRISLFVFENKEIPSLWIEKLKECQSVIVPSKFNYDSLKAAGLENVHVVNHAVDLKIWNNSIKMPRLNQDRKRIITVGTWRERKNWKNMALAVIKLIKENVNIEWTLKTDKSNQASEQVKKWLSENGISHLFNNNIKIDARILDESSMARLVSSHDILLSGSFGEGFGLPALQACFSKLLVVCPNYGGYREFFDNRTYFEVKAKDFLKINKMDNLTQFDNLEWPLYDKDSIADALYLCIEEFEKAKKMTDIVAEEASKKFNHQSIGLSFLNILQNYNAISINKN